MNATNMSLLSLDFHDEHIQATLCVYAGHLVNDDTPFCLF